MKYLKKPKKNLKVKRRKCLLCSTIYWESEKLANRNFKPFCCGDHYLEYNHLPAGRYKKKPKPKCYLDYLKEEYERSKDEMILCAIRFHKKHPDYLKNFKE